MDREVSKLPHHIQLSHPCRDRRQCDLVDMASQAPSKRGGDAPAEATYLIRGAAAAPGAGEAANQSRLPEELWGNVFSFLRAGEVHAVSQEMAAALRRPRLWQTFARHAGLASIYNVVPGQPGAERFRRARQLDGDAGGPASREDLEPPTCIVLVTQDGAEKFRGRFPLALKTCPFNYHYREGASARVEIAAETHGGDLPQRWLQAIQDNKAVNGTGPVLVVPAEASASFNVVVHEDPPLAGDHATRIRLALQPELEISFFIERDGRVAKLVTFGTPVDDFVSCASNLGTDHHQLQWYEQEWGTTLHTWHFELGLIASFPGLISGYQPGMPLEGHVRAMEFAVVSQIHEERSIEDQGTYIIERLADLISGPHLAWR